MKSQNAKTIPSTTTMNASWVGRNPSQNIYCQVAAVCALLCGLFLTPANAQTWYPNIPDFYQHQKYGPGNNQIEDPDWEKGGGWCFDVSTINQFFFFKKKGYNGLLDNDVTSGPPKWLPASSAAVKQFVADKGANSALQKACNAAGADPLLKDFINCILDNRGAGPKLGVGKGLIHVTLQQTYDSVKKQYDVVYYAADGSVKVLKENSTLFDAMQKYLNDGDSVNLFLAHDTSAKLWWSGPKPDKGNYHSVTVAGVDTTKGSEKIWFADPDSNPDHNHASKVLVEVAWLPGNMNKNAGWTPIDNMVNCGADGGMHTNLQCIRLRRFVGNEPIPVPAGNNPTQKEIDQRYFEAVMVQPDKVTFNGKNGDFDRYDGTLVLGLNVVGVVDAATKSGKLSPDGANIFEVSPGGDGATPIDEFWVFPTSYDEQITDVTDLPPGWQFESGSGLDPWGNDRPYGWVHVYTPMGPGYNPLVGNDVLDMTYDTGSGNPLTAWDAFVRYQGDDANLGVQAFGANPPVPPDQTPGSD